MACRRYLEAFLLHHERPDLLHQLHKTVYLCSSGKQHLIPPDDGVRHLQLGSNPAGIVAAAAEAVASRHAPDNSHEPHVAAFARATRAHSATLRSQPLNVSASMPSPTPSGGASGGAVTPAAVRTPPRPRATSSPLKSELHAWMGDWL